MRMIIVMSYEDTRGEAAAKVLAKKTSQAMAHFNEVDFSQIKDEKLILMDLRANGSFQDTFDGEVLAEKLHEQNLSLSVKVIDLYLSEIDLKTEFDNTQNSLPRTAHRLTHRLKELGNYEIVVRIVTDLDHAYTLLVPPQVAGKWQVYGIHRGDMIPQGKPVTFEELYQHPKKEWIWEGDDLDEYLCNPQKLYMPWKPEDPKALAFVDKMLEQRTVRGGESASYKPLFASGQVRKQDSVEGAQTQGREKLPRIVINEKNRIISLEMPLNPESQEIAEQLRERFLEMVSATQLKAK